MLILLIILNLLTTIFFILCVHHSDDNDITLLYISLSVLMITNSLVIGRLIWNTW